MHPVLLFLNAVYPLSASGINAFEERIQYADVKKKTWLLKAGQVCTNIYFIHSGLIRSFTKEGDKEICSWFMKEGDMVISIKSFYNQVRSEEYIQSLEDCSLSYMNFADLEKIYGTFLEFNYAGRVLTQKYYQ